MEIVLIDQTRVFVYAAVVGLALGLLYDIFSFFPEVFGRRVLGPVFDILYCVCFMTAFIVLLQTLCGGMIRWYLPGGIILGLCLYFCGFSDYVRMALSGLEKLIKTVGRFLLKAAEKISKLFDHPWGC